MFKKLMIVLGVVAALVAAAAIVFMVKRYYDPEEVAKRVLKKGFRGTRWFSTLSAFRDRYGKMSNGTLVNMSIDDKYFFLVKHDEDLHIFGATATDIHYVFPRMVLYQKGEKCQAGICPDNHRLTKVLVHFDKKKYSCKDIAAGMGKELGVELKPGLLPETAYELSKRKENAEKEGREDDSFPDEDSYLLEPEEWRHDGGFPSLLAHLTCRASEEIELIMGNSEDIDDWSVRDFYRREASFDKEAMLAEFLTIQGKPYLQNVLAEAGTEKDKVEMLHHIEELTNKETEFRESLKNTETRVYLWRNRTAVHWHDQTDYLIDTMKYTGAPDNEKERLTVRVGIEQGKRRHLHELEQSRICHGHCNARYRSYAVLSERPGQNRLAEARRMVLPER